MKKNWLWVTLLSSALILGSCSSNSSVPTLKFFSWNEYYDPSIIRQFEEENNVKVRIDYFANNEEALAKIEQQLTGSAVPEFDVFFPSDYIVEYLKNKDLLEKLDLSKMPHVKGNILPQLKTPIDPNHEYAIPYAWGTIGILYNDKYVKDPVESWSTVFEPSAEYQRKILMLDAPKELVGIALKYLGKSFNDNTPEALREAEKILKTQAPFVLNYNGDAIQEGMPNEEAYMAVSWSAEARFAMEKNSHLHFVIPKEGSNIWMDTLVILKGSQQRELAHKFIDFWYREDIMKKNWDYMHMSVPSISFLKTLPAEEQSNTTFYPTVAMLRKFDYNRDADEKTRVILNQIYTNIRS